MTNRRPVLILALTLLAGTADSKPRVLRGTVTWYGPGFHGRRMANGEVFDQNRSTLASRHIPLGSIVRVWVGNRSEVGRVTDVGGNGIADLSKGMATRLGYLHRGKARARLEVLRRGKGK